MVFNNNSAIPANITEEEISDLKLCRSQEEWNDTCDKIKSDRDGEYPPDWFQRVMMSGVMSSVKARW
jgi:hypothetical protein